MLSLAAPAAAAAAAAALWRCSALECRHLPALPWDDTAPPCHAVLTAVRVTLPHPFCCSAATAATLMPTLSARARSGWRCECLGNECLWSAWQPL